MAQHHLGWLYENGKGVEENLDTALDLIKKSADNGIVNSMGVLAGEYEFGRGVPMDLKESYFWSAFAERWAPKDSWVSRNRLSKASEWRAAASEVLREEERVTIETRVIDWMPAERPSTIVLDRH